MTLVGASDANILREVIEELRKTTIVEAATFLIRVKAHPGEPAKEDTEIQADKAISSKDVPMEWHDRKDRAVEPLLYVGHRLHQLVVLVC